MVMSRISDIIWLICNAPWPAIDKQARSIRFCSCWMRASPVNKRIGIKITCFSQSVDYCSHSYLLHRELLTLAQSALAFGISLMIHSFKSSTFTMVYSSGPRGAGIFSINWSPKSEVTVVWLWSKFLTCLFVPDIQKKPTPLPSPSPTFNDYQCPQSLWSKSVNMWSVKTSMVSSLLPREIVGFHFTMPVVSYVKRSSVCWLSADSGTCFLSLGDVVPYELTLNKIICYYTALFDLGDAPYNLLKEPLKRATAQQLYRIEKCNPVGIFPQNSSTTFSILN